MAQTVQIEELRERLARLVGYEKRRMISEGLSKHSQIFKVLC